MKPPSPISIVDRAAGRIKGVLPAEAERREVGALGTDIHSVAPFRQDCATHDPDPWIEQAIKVALPLHARQTRKGTDLPYIVHPVEVTKRER